MPAVGGGGEVGRAVFHAGIVDRHVAFSDLRLGFEASGSWGLSPEPWAKLAQSQTLEAAPVQVWDTLTPEGHASNML